MEYYTKKVNPFCPHGCGCFFHHFASTTVTQKEEPRDKMNEVQLDKVINTREMTDEQCQNLHKHCLSLKTLSQSQDLAPLSLSVPDEPSFTVLVNCSSQGLTAFPPLPPKTTVLALSPHQISAVYSLDPVLQNYQHISSLILSHNRLTTISTKLLKLKLDQLFKADHNAISLRFLTTSRCCCRSMQRMRCSLGTTPGPAPVVQRSLTW